MATSIPQTRPLLESDEGPISKKPRLQDVEAAAQPKPQKKKKRKDPPLPEPCTAADVLYHEIRGLLGADVVDEITQSGGAFQSPYDFGEEVEVEIDLMSSNGVGIAKVPEEKGPWTIVVPFVLPGETARVRIGKTDIMHSIGQLVQVLTKNTELRDDSRVRCQYFGKCGGCQYQMLSSETQLDLKRDVIVKAFKTYSQLPASAIPTIESTVESPLTYAYRTKITPHFDRPPRNANKKEVKPGERPPWFKIGFNYVNSSATMDIEECPIATSVLNGQYKNDRKAIIEKYNTYKKGVSLLYRDSLDPTFDAKVMMTPPINRLSDAFTKHVCVTDQKATARETIGDYLFEYTAGGFFQNNNAVLPLMVEHVRNLIQSSAKEGANLTHLVDTYCGAGLFAISLSSMFDKVAGIELSKDSIASAKKNADLNLIPEDKISFLAGDAFNIFETVKDFPANDAVVVIDPPRKGCDENFLKQLLDFRPNTVVYVSCNVHTQARDIDAIVRRTENEEEGKRYRMESLRGFDLFPQTAHVESVALLRLY